MCRGILRPGARRSGIRQQAHAPQKGGEPGFIPQAVQPRTGSKPDEPHIVLVAALDVHIRRLRKHLGSYANTYIETIFGVSYRFQPCRARASLESAQTTSSPLAPEAPSRIGLQACAVAGKNAYST